MADIKLLPEVASYLQTCIFTATTIKLPEGQLDRGFYEKLKKTFTLFGGKWTGGKTQAFVFTKVPVELITLKAGDVIKDPKKARQAFYTPAPIADIVADIAAVRGTRVLEPSAGGGALARACLSRGARSVTCIEIDPEACAALKKDFILTVCADFLSLNQILMSPHDRVVMNPPFTKGQGVSHVLHAIKLCPGASLFSILPDQEHPRLPSYTCEHRFPAGTFKESGTMIATQLISIRP